MQRVHFSRNGSGRGGKETKFNASAAKKVFEEFHDRIQKALVDCLVVLVENDSHPCTSVDHDRRTFFIQALNRPKRGKRRVKTLKAFSKFGEAFKKSAATLRKDARGSKYELSFNIYPRGLWAWASLHARGRPNGFELPKHPNKKHAKKQ